MADETNDEAEDLGGFRSTYGVTLLYSSPPELRKAQVFAALKKRLPQVEPLDPDSEDGVLAFVHPDHVVRYTDGEAPAQTFIAVLERTHESEVIDAAARQSWRFDAAHDVVETCRTSVLVSDLLSSGLPYQERFELFVNALLAVMDVAPPEGIHWGPSQQIVDPELFTGAAADGISGAFFAGAVNVRFFNIQNGEDDEVLMDTMGLAALGLPDLQCHFRGIDPDEIARYLYNTAIWLYENGDTIEDGEALESTIGGAVWRLQHEDALAEPHRTVIDVDPGDPFAAGERLR